MKKYTCCLVLLSIFKDDIINNMHAYNIEISIVGRYPFESLYRRESGRNSELHN